jgi:phosphate transport system protein
MFHRTWHRPLGTGGRDATCTQVIETIDRTAPETKAELAGAVGISEQYLSELLQELKAENIVRKGYVIDDDALYTSSGTISKLQRNDSESVDETASKPVGDRGTDVLSLLEPLESVTRRQYDAARGVFFDKSVDCTAQTLESLANERYSAVLDELKSYTLTTDWPGNRIAADLSTIATNLEIIGDRACFIADVVDTEGVDANGIVGDRMADIFASGAQINEYFSRIVFDCELEVHQQLREQEERVHRDLDELFELVTAYDPEMYGYLVTITRALERTIYYWVDAAELAVKLHSGIRPDHTEI